MGRKKNVVLWLSFSTPTRIQLPKWLTNTESGTACRISSIRALRLFAIDTNFGSNLLNRGVLNTTVLALCAAFKTSDLSNSVLIVSSIVSHRFAASIDVARESKLVSKACRCFRALELRVSLMVVRIMEVKR